ncbi:unnamed protein product [Allacma fusca]|uniref:Uncharacterized protein n=1 Tax=Allacma fusca TaxID=39272 RepID=A0A8J2L830_9HEXA|nr:unnamed protein product [Allacma fusca]
MPVIIHAGQYRCRKELNTKVITGIISTNGWFQDHESGNELPWFTGRWRSFWGNTRVNPKDTMIGSSIFSLVQEATLPKEETISLRQKHIPKSCALHFERSPLKVTRAFGQYLYDDMGVEYLDCVNCVAHVGHCNPNVVNAGKNAMLQMGCISVGMSDVASEYLNKLKTTFPPEMDTFLFVTSGSEANDLALQLARLNSSGHDVLAVEGSFHGSLSETNFISTKQTQKAVQCKAFKFLLLINVANIFTT